MCNDWNRPVEHLCRGDAPSAEFNGTHRHLALDELKVIHGEHITGGLLSAWDTDKRCTAGPVSDENYYNVGKISTISAIP